MIKQKNISFAQRLKAAKKILGREYVTITRRKYPNFTASQIRNVMNQGVENWEILHALEDIARIIEKNFVQNKQDLVG